jgi:hypothetical protein
VEVMKRIKVTITETARNCLKDEPSIFNEEVLYASDMAGIKELLKERYGKIPSARNKIYVDDKEGNVKECGFIYSFWNKDYSHNSKSWFQTDWVHFAEEITEDIPFNG